MTREEWINEILIPWKPGDVLQFLGRVHQEWQDVDMRYVTDPAHYMWCESDTYRIKPKMIQWIIETPTNVNQATFYNLAQNTAVGRFGSDFLRAIMDARRL